MASGLLRVTERELPRRPLPLRAADTRFRFGFRLATPNNSLTLASRRKTKHCYFHVVQSVARYYFHGHALSCLVIL